MALGTIGISDLVAAMRIGKRFVRRRVTVGAEFPLPRSQEFLVVTTMDDVTGLAPIAQRFVNVLALELLAVMTLIAEFRLLALQQSFVITRVGIVTLRTFPFADERMKLGFPEAEPCCVMALDAQIRRVIRRGCSRREFRGIRIQQGTLSRAVTDVATDAAGDRRDIVTRARPQGGVRHRRSARAVRKRRTLSLVAAAGRQILWHPVVVTTEAVTAQWPAVSGCLRRNLRG